MQADAAHEVNIAGASCVPVMRADSGCVLRLKAANTMQRCAARRAHRHLWRTPLDALDQRDARARQTDKPQRGILGAHAGQDGVHLHALERNWPRIAPCCDLITLSPCWATLLANARKQGRK